MKRRLIATCLCIVMLCANVLAYALEAEAKEVDSGAEISMNDENTEIYQNKEELKFLAYAGFDTKAVYLIRNVLSGKYLNIPGNSSKRVTPITIWEKDNTTGQKFTFTKVSGWYTLTPKCAPSLRVNVEGESSANNKDVGLYANTKHSTQGWYFEAVSGGYVIRSANNKNCVLDVRGTGNGAKVKIATYKSGSKGQIWKVEKCSVPVVNNPTVNKPAEPKSTLSVAPKLNKTTITKGSYNGVSGTVKSNKNITKITAQILKQGSNQVLYSKTVIPNKTTYSLNGEINNAMLFNKLASGSYTFKVTAWDASGNMLSKSIGCTVKASNKGPSLKKYSDITVVMQKTNSDCALASMATCELYREKNNKKAVWKNLLKNAKDPYETLKSKNGGTYGNWSTIKYGKNIKISGVTSKNLKRLYDEVKKGPVIIGKTWGNSGSHFSVVYKYTGSAKKIQANQFVVVDVYNGEKMSLTKWLGNIKSSAKGNWSRIIAK